MASELEGLVCSFARFLKERRVGQRKVRTFTVNRETKFLLLDRRSALKFIKCHLTVDRETKFLLLDRRSALKFIKCHLTVDRETTLNKSDLVYEGNLA